MSPIERGFYFSVQKTPAVIWSIEMIAVSASLAIKSLPRASRSDFTMVFGKAIAIMLLYASALFYPRAHAFAQPPVRQGALQEQPLQTVKAYLQAIHARDPRRAYGLISATDRSVRDESTHLYSQPRLEGFALELARTLAAGLDVRIIEQNVESDKARLEVFYRVPTGDELSAQLLDWNERKLDALRPAAKQRLAASLEDLKRQGKMITLEGRETFRLVREKNRWKIFLDWASRTRVIFKSRIPSGEELEVRFPRNDFLIAMNQPLQVDFTLKNRSRRPIVARLNHQIEPRRFADMVEMIACGSLAPVRLEPGETREFWSSYILAGMSAKSRLSIVYEFNVAFQKADKAIFPTRHAGAP